MRVLSLSTADMRETYEVLTALESMAAELVARQRLGTDQIAPMAQAMEEMEKALSADDLDAWARADEQFHAHLVELAGNRTLKAAVMNHWDRTHRARMFSLRLRPKPVQSTKEHRALLKRLRAGDAEGAAREYRAHRERASRELLAIFEQYKITHM
jgi:DNA-binding GntR family transcriptional regulator